VTATLLPNLGRQYVGAVVNSGTLSAGQEIKLVYHNGFTPPKQGMFIAHGKPYENGVTTGYWHVLGGVLVRHQGHDHLCALDESSYFVAKLPDRVDKVEDAVDA